MKEKRRRNENEPMEEDVSYNHPSYGMAEINRHIGSPRPMFGSSIQHGNTISLSIYHGTKDRHVGKEWYFAKEKIIGIEMSQTQWAELLCSAGIGGGVPVTITNYPGHTPVERCPEESLRKQTVKEFKADTHDIRKQINDLKNQAKELISKKNWLKKDREDLAGLIGSLTQNVISNLPYVAESFNRNMDKVVSAAKGEVEAFVQNKITQAGIKALHQEYNAPQIEQSEEIVIEPEEE